MTAPLKQFGEADWYETDLPPILRPQRPRPLRTLAILALVLFSGSLIGISSAYFIIERERPLMAVRIGPWETYPYAGTAEADPYSVAIYTRGAKIPLASGEGVDLIARTDSVGDTLQPMCRYRIHGQTPTARLWTLTATNGSGRLMKTLPGRSNLTSRQLLREPDGSFDIVASTTPQPGNWLPLAEDPFNAEGLRFNLRLYDAPVSTGSALKGVSMPVIDRIDCL